jgi:hypothetical protein
MTNSIPASQLVSVIPGVLSAGGNPLALNAVFLTQDVSVPLGTAMPFSTAADVAAWFGPNSPEAALAAIYFSGFAGSNQLPGLLYFVQFNTAAVGAYLRSASLAGMSLTTLQGASGTLNVTVDGKAITSAAINLSGASSFSAAAALIQTGLTAGTTFTGTAAQTASADVMNVTATASGVLHVGDILSGSGVDSGLTVVSFGTYTPTSGMGTVIVSTTTGFTSTNVSVAGIATVTFDAQRDAFVVHSPTTGANSTVGFGSGSFAPLVFLTQATGATLSQGAIAATPAGVMAQVVSATQNWATFMTVAEVTDSVKLQFAAWVNGTTERYMYVCQDSNVLALSANQPTTFGALTAADNGVCPVYDTTGGTLAAFICGTTASIDFTENDGRITFAYKSNSLLVPQITDATTATNLQGNGYNFYAQYATAAEGFQILYPGVISGAWDWIDTYVNQIYLNSQLQLALMVLLTSVKSLPYNAAGYGLIRAACLDPINQALAFGSIQSGVALSASQAASVNAAAGIQIDQTLQNVGWYLQILPASSQTRGARTSPPMTLWYTDGGSIQKLNLASIDVQ